MNKSLPQWEFNPVIVKEIRSRMRGGRAFTTLTGVLILLGGFSYTLYRVAIAASNYSNTPASPQIGQILFAGLAFLELMMICSIVPAVTAGAISGEKEGQTYEMLLTTPLHPASILWGKLIAALSYVFILIFAAVPLSSLVFTFGGVALRDIFKAIVILGIVTVMFGVLGLFLSALLGRTGRATAVTYLIVLLMLFGPLFAAMLAGAIEQSQPPRWLLVLSPISALGSALTPSFNPSSLSNMFWALGNSIYWIMGSPEISLTNIPRPLYHYSLPIYGAVILILYLLATRLVKPSKRWKLHWTEGLLALVFLAGYAGVIMAAYASTTNRYENVLFSTPAEAGPTQSLPSDNKIPPNPVENPAGGLPQPIETPTPYPPPEKGFRFPEIPVGWKAGLLVTPLCIL
jgi:ABC-2 type transport system permease protein